MTRQDDLAMRNPLWSTHAVTQKLHLTDGQEQICGKALEKPDNRSAPVLP